MAGHVFIVRGDLTRLACDAWLLPCDQTFFISPGWHDALPDHVRRLLRGSRLDVEEPAEWGNDGARVRRLDEWQARSGEPQPWLVNTGGDWSTDPEWYLEGVREFVETAVGHVETPLLGRAKPLVGLPLIATGLGGRSEDAGEIVRLLLPELEDLARGLGADLVLVLRGAAAFAAAQYARLKLHEGDEPWGELSGTLGAEVERMAAIAATGKLVLFLGAGVSASAGVPLWGELIRQLATRAGFSERELEALGELDPSDRANLIESRLPIDPRDAERPIGRAVRDVIAPYRTSSLTHALLASLPTSAAVTTNYDTLFEEACRAAGCRLAVLPYENPREADRWLLKVHGCVTHPDDIVLTRQDYMRYGDRRGALQGIVQALLVTHHMLFVGFSLTDPNFYQIADDVRKALNPAAGEPADSEFGTALTLHADPIQAELWKRDLTLVPVGDSSNPSDADAARSLEIMLDPIVARSGLASQHLLKSAFDGALTPGERELRDGLRTFEGALTADARRQPAFGVVERMLTSLGGGQPSRRLEV